MWHVLREFESSLVPSVVVGLFSRLTSNLADYVLVVWLGYLDFLWQAKIYCY